MDLKLADTIVRGSNTIEKYYIGKYVFLFYTFEDGGHFYEVGVRNGMQDKHLPLIHCVFSSNKELKSFTIEIPTKSIFTIEETSKLIRDLEYAEDVAKTLTEEFIRK